MAWEDEQLWEASWWGDCINTFGEEAKQLTYAQRMGLENVPQVGRWPVYDLGYRSVVDFGGGPVSILLKAVNLSRGTVVDPLSVPPWVIARYEQAGVDLVQVPAEEFRTEDRFQEAWLYNVLQHTIDPERIVANARASADLVRIFEWIDTPQAEGHPHTLRRHELDRWFGGRGTVEDMNENGCVGPAYYGVFR